MALDESEWAIIHTYTRAQAIEDGVLVDLASFPVCREHYKYPIACTAAVWNLIAEATSDSSLGNDIEGILHDILFVSRSVPTRTTETSSHFEVVILEPDGLRTYAMQLVCGPGDSLEPVLTLMLEGED